MRKALLPAFTAAAVFCTCFFCQRHTLMQQEFNGLFLLTGDYFREVFSGSLLNPPCRSVRCIPHHPGALGRSHCN